MKLVLALALPVLAVGSAALLLGVDYFFAVACAAGLIAILAVDYSRPVARVPRRPRSGAARERTRAQDALDCTLGVQTLHS